MDVLERAKHLGEAGLVWLGGRGLSYAVVGLAAGFGGLSAGLLPLVSLPIAWGVSHYIKQMRHHHHEVHMLGEYRHEIAAIRGRDPSSLSVEDLHIVAEGSPALGIPRNETLCRELERNDKYRNIRLFSDLIGSVLAIGAVVAANLILGPAVVSEAIPRIALMFGAGIGSFFAASMTALVWEKAAGVDQANLSDKIHEIKNRRAYGMDVTPQYVLELFADANPPLAQEIHTRLRGEYAQATPDQKQALVQVLDRELHLRDWAAAINDGRVRANELAFGVHGRLSGVPEQPPGTYKEETVLNEVVRLVRHPVRYGRQNAITESPASALTPVAALQEDYRTDFAERFAPAARQGESFVERHGLESREGQEWERYIEHRDMESPSGPRLH